MKTVVVENSVIMIFIPSNYVFHAAVSYLGFVCIMDYYLETAKSYDYYWNGRYST